MFVKMRHTVLVLTLLLLTGCGDPTVAEMVQKSEKVSSKAELENVLGKPHEISKVGPVETWTYKAKDGQVSFLITGDRVTMSAAGSRR